MTTRKALLAAEDEYQRAVVQAQEALALALRAHQDALQAARLAYGRKIGLWA